MSARMKGPAMEDDFAEVYCEADDIDTVQNLLAAQDLLYELADVAANRHDRYMHEVIATWWWAVEHDIERRLRRTVTHALETEPLF